MRKLVAAFLMLVFATVHVAANAYVADSEADEPVAVALSADDAEHDIYPVGEVLTSDCCDGNEVQNTASGTPCTTDCVLGLVDERTVFAHSRASPMFSRIEPRRTDTSSGLYRPPIAV